MKCPKCNKTMSDINLSGDHIGWACAKCGIMKTWRQYNKELKVN